MAPFRRLARLGTVAVLALSLVGCAVRPPDWAYFDTDRHPVGATAACSGYYAGAYVVYPVTMATVFLLGLLFGPDTSFEVAVGGTEGHRGGASAVGTGLGVIVGAPFHYLALPFQEYEVEPDHEVEGRNFEDREVP